ncbi:MAG: type II secretion system GspH family protein [Hydrogenimonas sp.]|nr:type II secretion system GspH family protein [Hydrogenimonas sp.]
MRSIRSAFTLVELTLVIMVFGIVAAISSEIYAKIYENYLVSRVTNSLQTKTELALEQIAKRLQYRIKAATIATNPGTNDFKSLVDLDTNDNDYKILEWIGYDDEGFKGINNNGLPIWSGFADVNASTADSIITPGSTLTEEDDIIKDLSNDGASINDAAIIFPVVAQDFDISKFGWYGNDSDYVFNVINSGDEVLNITDSTQPSLIYERYKLVWTAYAIAPQPLDCIDDCNLTLYWNYQPWQGDIFNNANSRSLLAENVTTFKFRQDGDVIRLKLCIKGKIVDKNVSVCKEKVVF